MAKICRKCGFRSDDGATACRKCGASFAQKRTVSGASVGRNLSREQKIRLNKLAKLLVPVAVFILAVLILIFGIIVPNTGVKGTVKKYFDAIEDQKVGKYTKVISQSEKLLYGLVGEEELEIEIEDDLRSRMDSLEELYGKNVRIKIKITDVDDMTTKALNVIRTDYSLSKDLEMIEIDEGVEVDFDIRYKGKDSHAEGDGTAYVIKEDGKWKIHEVILDV